MELKDLFLAPIYMLILYGIAVKIRNKHFKGHPFEPYFMKALHLKFFGAIAAGMVYWFYYNYGDTRGFFIHGKIVYNYILNDFSTFSHYMFPNAYSDQPYQVLLNLKKSRAFDDTASYFMIKLVAFFSFFTFNTYTCIAILLAFFNFLCSLYCYKALVKMYHNLSFEIALAIFFIPNVIFWGSGLFKDNITFAGLLLVLGAFLNVLNNSNVFRNLLFVFFGSYLIISVKTYVILSFAPCAALYLFLKYNHKIKSKAVRSILMPFFLALGALTSYFIITQLGELSPRWNMENIEKQAYDMQWWHESVQKISGDYGAGSYYNVGEIGDFSISGMLLKLPLVLSITFFRPFIWEVKNPFMLLASLEGLFFLLLTLKVIRKYGLFRFISSIFKNPIVAFFFMYAVIFGFAVGYTSFNYGALVRYKIPCLPFYLLFVYFNEYYLSKEIQSSKISVKPQLKNQNVP
jgi:hypothetical protein